MIFRRVMSKAVKGARLAGLGLILACSQSFAQQATPKPTQTPSDTDVVRVMTNLVQLDVTVVDAKGKVITDLGQDEVEIYENGKKQKITNFSFISAVPGATSKNVPVDNPNMAPASTLAIQSQSVRRTFALVVDDLSLSFESTHRVRRALKKFVDEQMQPGDLVAIVRTGSGVGALQQFTSDKQVLYAAIEQVKWNAMGRAGTTAFASTEPTQLELAKAMGDATVSEEDLKAEREFLASHSDARDAHFATGSLGTMRAIVTGMGDLPGRKSVILFSDGFATVQRIEQGFSDTGRVGQVLRQLVELANRSSVVFYAIDTRGLQTMGLGASDKVIGATPDSMLSAIRNGNAAKSNEMFETQGGLQALADETGGFAVLNSADLSSGLRRVLNDQSYYLIGYEPESETFDAKAGVYNKVEVRLSRDGAKARYRSGTANLTTARPAKEPAKQSAQQQLTTALSSPFSRSEISLSLNPLFGYDPKEGSFVRSLLHVNARDLTFKDEPNGGKKLEFMIMAASFGDNGVPDEKFGLTYSVTLDKQGYQKMLDDGFVYDFTFPVKKSGPYQFRVALRDSVGKLGSASQFIKIPDLKAGPAMSSIMLESYTDEQWKIIDASAVQDQVKTDPMNDTSRRKFFLGGVLRYGFEIYDTTRGSRRQNISTKIRMFRDGKIVLDGQYIPLDLTGQKGGATMRSVGAIRLGSGMQPGDYILQVIVTDGLGQEKRRIGMQFVQFELLDKGAAVR